MEPMKPLSPAEIYRRHAEWIVRSAAEQRGYLALIEHSRISIVESQELLRRTKPRYGQMR